MASEFFGRQRECRFYTAGCGNKMAVSVTGPRAVNELGGRVIPGRLGYGGIGFNVNKIWKIFFRAIRTSYWLNPLTDKLFYLNLH